MSAATKAAPTPPATGHPVRRGAAEAAQLSVRDLSAKVSKRFPKVLAELAK
ncbi:MAG: hypothetical protein WA840_06320 [Caulobacteraceae bacterium]